MTVVAASLSLLSAAPAASETAAPPSDRRLSESTTLQFTFSQIRQTDISVALGRLILYDAGGAELWRVVPRFRFRDALVGVVVGY